MHILFFSFLLITELKNVGLRKKNIFRYERAIEIIFCIKKNYLKRDNNPAFLYNFQEHIEKTNLKIYEILQQYQIFGKKIIFL